LQVVLEHREREAEDFLSFHPSSSEKKKHSAKAEACNLSKRKNSLFSFVHQIHLLHTQELNVEKGENFSLTLIL
jgi:hypothetical protein